jgi:hypothetical protein
MRSHHDPILLFSLYRYFTTCNTPEWNMGRKGVGQLAGKGAFDLPPAPLPIIIGAGTANMAEFNQN